MSDLAIDAVDSSVLRKSRGAFFTPPELCDYVARWAVRDPADRVLEPSCGEAAFLLAAGRRLQDLRTGASDREDVARPTGQLVGVELHASSARQGAQRLVDAGIAADIRVADFFTVEPEPSFDAVVGNPPYVRYQEFAGAARAQSRQLALSQGVRLSALASSWAAFTVHAALHLKPGGRLGLVLPAELLSVNYAADVRGFLMRRFSRVQLVFFDQLVFPKVQEEVVLLLAEGTGSTDHCELHQVRDVSELPSLPGPGLPYRWTPPALSGKWTQALLSQDALEVYRELLEHSAVGQLQQWGETSLGAVTGNNRFFAITPAQVEDLRLPGNDIVPLSPPGSRHLRAATFTGAMWERLGGEGAATWLFRPSSERPSAAAAAYIRAGEAQGVHQAYKCRVRNPWWRVPVQPPADLFLTYMNADTPRLAANRAGVLHLNSVHGVYLKPGLRRLGMDLLPLASLNSLTLLGAETVGRAYGGGMLKLEPKEADLLPIPTPAATAEHSAALRGVRSQVVQALRAGLLPEAVSLVDQALLVECLGVPAPQVRALRRAQAALSGRRSARAGTAGRKDLTPRAVVASSADLASIMER